MKPIIFVRGALLMALAIILSFIASSINVLYISWLIILPAGPALMVAFDPIINKRLFVNSKGKKHG